MRLTGFISENNQEYLSTYCNSERRFYLLPKNHKKRVPWRPICSSVNLWTNISKPMFPKLKPTSGKQNFISEIKELRLIPEGAKLCTLCPFYTLMFEKNEGILATAEKLRNDPRKTHIVKFILDLLTLELHNMSFEFNGEHSPDWLDRHGPKIIQLILALTKVHTLALTLPSISLS